MSLLTESYWTQVARWPKTGRHILGQFNDESFIVYQAYNEAIGRFAASHGYFGGAFSLTRMSWLKPNFLWMMYRSGWGTKEGQQMILAIHLRRVAFDAILQQAVHATFVPHLYTSEAAWKNALAHSDVLLQWDPDHNPVGAKVERRAIQLGLRGEVLALYARNWIMEIEDITPFVRQQYQYIQAQTFTQLATPKETLYSINDQALATKLGLDR